MFPISPLDYLAAFALSFLGGVLLAMFHSRRIDTVRREASAHA